MASSSGTTDADTMSITALRMFALECPVCMEAMDDESRLSMAAPCGHVIHHVCQQRWEQQQISDHHLAITCPMCRQVATYCTLFYNPLASVAALLTDVDNTIKGAPPERAVQLLQGEEVRLKMRLSELDTARSSMAGMLDQAKTKAAQMEQQISSNANRLAKMSKSVGKETSAHHKACKEGVKLKEEYNKVLDSLAGHRQYLQDVDPAEYSNMTSEELGNQVSMLLESLRQRRSEIQMYQKKIESTSKSRMELEVKLLDRVNAMEKQSLRTEDALDKLNAERDVLVQRYKDLSEAVKDQLAARRVDHSRSALAGSGSSSSTGKSSSSSSSSRMAGVATSSSLTRVQSMAANRNEAKSSQRSILRQAFASIGVMERLPKGVAAKALDAARDMTDIVQLGQRALQSRPSHQSWRTHKERNRVASSELTTPPTSRASPTGPPDARPFPLSSSSSDRKRRVSSIAELLPASGDGTGTGARSGTGSLSGNNGTKVPRSGDKAKVRTTSSSSSRSTSKIGHAKINTFFLPTPKT